MSTEFVAHEQRGYSEKRILVRVSIRARVRLRRRIPYFFLRGGVSTRKKRGAVGWRRLFAPPQEILECVASVRGVFFFAEFFGTRV